MGTIRVNVSAVLSQGHELADAQRTVMDVKGHMDSLVAQIDPDIMTRNNIGNRLRNATRQLDEIQDKIGRIQRTVETGANCYYSADMDASQKARDIAVNK